MLPLEIRLLKYNYSLALNNVLKDMDLWNSHPISIRARVSIIKMNVLPRINFVSSMVLLSPPSFDLQTPNLSGIVSVRT